MSENNMASPMKVNNDSQGELQNDTKLLALNQLPQSLHSNLLATSDHTQIVPITSQRHSNKKQDN